MNEEALDSLRNEEKNEDRERIQQKKEDSFEALPIMEKLDAICTQAKELGQLAKELEELSRAKQDDYHMDAKYGMI